MLRAGLAVRERVGRVTLSRDHAPCGSGSQGESGASDSVSRPCSVRVWRSGRVGRVTLSRDHAPCGSGGQGESGRVTVSLLCCV